MKKEEEKKSNENCFFKLLHEVMLYRTLKWANNEDLGALVNLPRGKCSHA